MYILLPLLEENSGEKRAIPWPPIQITLQKKKGHLRPSIPSHTNKNCSNPHASGYVAKRCFQTGNHHYTAFSIAASG